MIHRFLALLAIVIVPLAAACSRQVPPIPSGDIALYAVKIDRFGSLEPVPPYTVALLPDSPTVAQLPDRIGSSPTWSPNGEWIAAVNDVGDSLLLLRTSGETAIRFPTGLSNISHVAWFPDSLRLAFSAVGTGSQRSIYALDLSCLSSDPRCRPSPEALYSGQSPSISYDGRWLAYTQRAWDCRDLDPDCEAIFIAPADGTGTPTNITSPLQTILSHNEWPMWGCSDPYANPQWSPRSLTLAFSCGFDVYTYTLDSGALQNLTSIITRLHTEHSFPEWWPRDYMPAWTPQGDRILFLSDRIDACDEGSDFIANALFMMNPDGTDLVRVTRPCDEMIRGYTWIYR